MRGARYFIRSSLIVMICMFVSMSFLSMIQPA